MQPPRPRLSSLTNHAFPRPPLPLSLAPPAVISHPSPLLLITQVQPPLYSPFLARLRPPPLRRSQPIPPYTPRATPYASRFTFHVSRFTPYALRFTLYVLSLPPLHRRLQPLQLVY